MSQTRDMQITCGVLALLAVMGLADPAPAQRRGGCGAVEASDWNGSLVPEGEPGEPMEITGRVLDAEGDPAPGVNVYAYQTDAEGYYSRRGSDENTARLCAVVRTNERGEYKLTTIRPGSYASGGVPAHIHFELWRDGMARERQELQFADDAQVAAPKKADLTRTSTVRSLDRDDQGVWKVERDFRLP